MNPSSDAIRWKGRSISRELLDQYIHSTARHLKEFGIKDGSVVVISARVSPAYLIVLLSLWQLRIAPYLMPPGQASFGTLRNNKKENSVLRLVDEKQEQGKREVFLDDMVVLEMVEGFLSASSTDRVEYGRDLRAVIFVSPDGTESPVTFDQLGGISLDAPLSQETILRAPLHQIEGLAMLYQSVKAGRTVVL